MGVPPGSLFSVFWGCTEGVPCLQVARQSLTTYVVIMNSTHIEIDVHRLNDGGLLLSYDGCSYTTYMKEEIDRYPLPGPPCRLRDGHQPAGDTFPCPVGTGSPSATKRAPSRRRRTRRCCARPARGSCCSTRWRTAATWTRGRFMRRSR